MFLVDTSVWVDYLRGTSTQSVEKFQRILKTAPSLLPMVASFIQTKLEDLLPLIAAIREVLLSVEAGQVSHIGST